MENSGPPRLPTSRQAVVQSEKSPGGFELTNRSVPVPLSHQIVIKVVAVALNQCDWKTPLRVPCPGAIDGADYSGTIVRVGESAAVDYGWKIGDRVVGAKVASNIREPWAGAFTEYVVEEADGCWRVPETLSWEEAAAVGCAVTTSVGTALWISSKLPGTPETPTLKRKYVLVYGGATASGAFAIQLLRL
jgi:NADPH:quinone reductase-like Zn-dependent oxidoreductase